MQNECLSLTGRFSGRYIFKIFHNMEYNLGNTEGLTALGMSIWAQVRKVIPGVEVLLKAFSQVRTQQF